MSASGWTGWLLYSEWSIPGPPCRSNTVGRSTIAGPSGTRPRPSTSTYNRTPPPMSTRMVSTLRDNPDVSLEWEQTNVDARDAGALGRWWREALGGVVVNDDPDEFEIRPTADRLPGLLFVPVPEAKQVKNRLHLDF